MTYLDPPFQQHFGKIGKKLPLLPCGIRGRANLTEVSAPMMADRVRLVGRGSRRLDDAADVHRGSVRLRHRHASHFSTHPIGVATVPHNVDLSGGVPQSVAETRWVGPSACADNCIITDLIDSQATECA